jgi:3-oxoacid CoA-transferase
VPIGSLSPNAIHLPGIYIDRIVPATAPKVIEYITLAPDSPTSDTHNREQDYEDTRRRRIARRAAKEIKDGFYVNLGIGMPTLVPEYLEPGVKVWIQSENGILGMGPYPTKDQLDAQVFMIGCCPAADPDTLFTVRDLINAGKETVTLVPGASIFGACIDIGLM